jgi:hypothetical protein
MFAYVFVGLLMKLRIKGLLGVCLSNGIIDLKHIIINKTRYTRTPSIEPIMSNLTFI